MQEKQSLEEGQKLRTERLEKKPQENLQQQTGTDGWRTQERRRGQEIRLNEQEEGG